MRFPFQAAVVGTSFRDQAARAVRSGATAQLRREPDNPHDNQAIAVDVDGHHVGYLPRALSARLVGELWDAVVTDVFRGDGVGLRIRVTGPAHAASDAGAAPCFTPTAGSPTPTVGDLSRHGDVLVRARSGRVLGLLVSRENGKVRVATSDGRTVTYPADLVETQNVVVA